MVNINQCVSIESENAEHGQCLIINNSQARAKISLFGGQLLSFIPSTDNRDRLWLSDKAIFDGSTPIRGGVPICWPWFGHHKRKTELPSHGFVRTQMWQLVDVQEIKNSSNVVESTKCSLVPSVLGQFATLEQCKLRLSITVAQTCEIKLTTINHSQKTMALSQAIHSYFSVDDISSVCIEGINADYVDKLDQDETKTSPSPYLILEETDRVHGLNNDKDKYAPQLIRIEASTKQACTHIEHSGHSGTVVWNPWINKSLGMKDMSAEGFKNMLCIEAVTVPEIILAPSEQHVLTQRFY